MPEFKHKDIIALRDLTKEEIELLLSTAESMREINNREIKKVPTLRGKTIINLFYESSTRTRTSFELAEKTPVRGHGQYFSFNECGYQGRDPGRYGAQPDGHEAGHRCHASMPFPGPIISLPTSCPVR